VNNSPDASIYGILVSLRIGAVQLWNVRVMVSDVFRPFAQVTGTPIDGIVGYKVLRRLKIIMDFPAETLQLQSQ
jgi:hypothetical protein